MMISNLITNNSNIYFYRFYKNSLYYSNYENK